MHNSHVEPVQTHGTDAHLRPGHAPCSDRGVDPSGRATARRAWTSRSHHASHRRACGGLTRNSAAVLPEQGRDPGGGDGATQTERRTAKGSRSPRPRARGRLLPDPSRPLPQRGSPGSERTTAPEPRRRASHSILDQQPFEPAGSLPTEGSTAVSGPPRRSAASTSDPAPRECTLGTSGSLGTTSHPRDTARSGPITVP